MRTLCLFALTIAAAAPAHAQEPQWLTEARAREGKEFAPTAVVAQDKSFRARVPAKVVTKKIVKAQDSYSVAFDVGADSPIECEINPEEYDPAAALALGAKGAFKLIGDARGRIERKQVVATDAGSFDDAPFLAVNWLFIANDGKGARVGGIQQILALRNGYGIYCIHTELGYQKTFRALATALVTSLDVAKKPETPHYADVSVATVRGQRLGFNASWVTTDADGDRKFRSLTSMLAVRSDGEVKASDYQSIEWIRSDGTLINSVYVKSEQGEIDANLHLKRDAANKWRVSGTFKSKEIDEAIKEGPDPESAIGHTDALKKVLATSAPVGTKATSMRWSPGADPTVFSQIETIVLKQVAADRFEVLENDGDMKVSTVVERQTGITVSGTMQVGPIGIDIQRVYASGAY